MMDSLCGRAGASVKAAPLQKLSLTLPNRFLISKLTRDLAFNGGVFLAFDRADQAAAKRSRSPPATL